MAHNAPAGAIGYRRKTDHSVKTIVRIRWDNWTATLICVVTGGEPGISDEQALVQDARNRITALMRNYAHLGQEVARNVPAREDLLRSAGLAGILRADLNEDMVRAIDIGHSDERLEMRPDDYPPAPFLRLDQRVAYEEHRIGATKLLGEPEVVRVRIRGEILRQKQEPGNEIRAELLNKWGVLSLQPVERMVEPMLATDFESTLMRMVGVFMEVLTAEDRAEAEKRAERGNQDWR